MTPPQTFAEETSSFLFTLQYPQKYESLRQLRHLPSVSFGYLNVFNVHMVEQEQDCVDLTTKHND